MMEETYKAASFLERPSKQLSGVRLGQEKRVTLQRHPLPSEACQAVQAAARGRGSVTLQPQGRAQAELESRNWVMDLWKTTSPPIVNARADTPTCSPIPEEGWVPTHSHLHAGHKGAPAFLAQHSTHGHLTSKVGQPPNSCNWHLPLPSPLTELEGKDRDWYHQQTGIRPTSGVHTASTSHSTPKGSSSA